MVYKVAYVSECEQSLAQLKLTESRSCGFATSLLEIFEFAIIPGCILPREKNLRARIEVEVHLEADRSHRREEDPERNDDASIASYMTCASLILRLQKFGSVNRSRSGNSALDSTSMIPAVV
jgi:hypothetical protein